MRFQDPNVGLLYSADDVPGYIRNSPAWKFITAIEDELKVVQASNSKFVEFLMKVKKLIEQIKADQRVRAAKAEAANGPAHLSQTTPELGRGEKSRTLSPTKAAADSAMKKTGPESIDGGAFLRSRHSRSNIRLVEVGIDGSEQKMISPARAHELLSKSGMSPSRLR